MVSSPRSQPRLSKAQIASLIYHDIFDYPLTRSELIRWKTSLNCSKSTAIGKLGEYYFIKGRRDLVAKRISRLKHSQKKLLIAQKASSVLGKIPTIRFIGITGSLAMSNSRKGSDIDLLFITQNGTLWTTRPLVYLFCRLWGFETRKAGEQFEKDKLCLNMWLDEKELFFSHHNVFTAHELSQVVTLVNKSHTYEKLISMNKWIFKYWPNATPRVKRIPKKNESGEIWTRILIILEPIAYWFQYQYMRSKKSREIVTPTKAFFHPFDWGEWLLIELKRRRIKSNTLISTSHIS